MVMALICLVGSVATSFLPETVGCKLPETIEVKYYKKFFVDRKINVIFFCTTHSVRIVPKMLLV